MKTFTIVGALMGGAAAARNGYGYMDDWTCTSAACFVPYLKSVVTTGLNNVVLGFTMPVGSTESSSWYYDSTGAYNSLTDAQRDDIQAHYVANNAHLWMSIGGGTYHATTYLAQDPSTVARLACTRAKTQGYYGVDFDLEEVSQANWDQFLPWAITASQTCAGIIPHIAHAPQSPYLGAWLNYGYEKLIPYVEHMLVQYYNQGRPYNSEATLWAATNDGSKEGWTDFLQLNAEFKDVVVIGKYLRPQDGGSGMVTAPEFDALLKIGEDKYGYNNGYMIWKIPMAAETGDLTAFINTHIPLLVAGGGALPTEAPVVPVPTTTTTLAPAPTTTTTLAPVPTTTTTLAPAPTTTTTLAPVPTTTTTLAPSVAPGLPTTSTASTTTTPAGPEVTYCQSVLTHPLADWAQRCKELCVYYHDTPAFCPGGVATGEALAACVLQTHSDSCQSRYRGIDTIGGGNIVKGFGAENLVRPSLPVAPVPPIGEVPTTTTTTTTPAGPEVSYCQSVLTHPLADWAQRCKELCVYYHDTPAFCPGGVATGEALAACVLQTHSDSCQSRYRGIDSIGGGNILKGY